MITKYWHYSMISTDIILRLKVVRNFTSQNLKHESWTIHRLQHNLHGALRNRSSSANVLRNPNKYHPLSLMMCTTRDQCSFTILNTSNVTIYNIKSHETTLCNACDTRQLLSKPDSSSTRIINTKTGKKIQRQMHSLIFSYNSAQWYQYIRTKDNDVNAFKYHRKNKNKIGAFITK